jgi:signal transduction histidine kinase
MPDTTSELARLLSLIAHELRTPLSVTSGYLKMLASERPGPLTDTQKHAVGGASRSCDLLATVAADISLLGRLERGEITPQPVPIDIAHLVDEITHGYASNPDHPVAVEVAGDDPPAHTLHADAGHVRRALTAFLAAVVRSAPDDSTVRIAWRTANDGPPRLLVGLALADRLDALLDEPEGRLSALDESQAGLGMVLPIARRLLALSGATIHAARDSQALGLRVTLPLSV